MRNGQATPTETIFPAPYPIPEIGAEPGDHIFIRPNHPDAPLAVVKRFGRSALEHFLRHHSLQPDPTRPRLEILR